MASFTLCAMFVGVRDDPVTPRRFSFSVSKSEPKASFTLCAILSGVRNSPVTLISALMPAVALAAATSVATPSTDAAALPLACTAAEASLLPSNSATIDQTA